MSSYLVLKLGLNPTTVDSVVVGKGKEVKIKPGQHLHVVNHLYPYTVQFKEDPRGNQSDTKRPKDRTLGEGESQRAAQSMRAVNQTEKVPASVGHGGATKTNVKGKYRNT